MLVLTWFLKGEGFYGRVRMERESWDTVWVA